MTNAPFKPVKGYAQAMTTTDAVINTASQNTNCYRIYNASAADLLVRPSYMSEYIYMAAWQTQIFSFGVDEVITGKLSTGTGTLYITCGEGR